MIFPAAALARAKRGNFSRHEGAGRTHSVLAYICASLCRRALCALAAPRAGPYSYKYNASFVHAFIYIYIRVHARDGERQGCCYTVDAKNLRWLPVLFSNIDICPRALVFGSD